MYLNSETNSLKNLILISVVEPIQNSKPSFPPQNGEKRFVKEVAIVSLCSKRRLATHYLSRKSTLANQVVEFVCLW